MEIIVSNSNSKILDIAERGDFARFLKPSTNVSRMLEYRRANYWRRREISNSRKSVKVLIIR